MKNPIVDTVRKILFAEWDPIGINENADLSDEYDSYVLKVVSLLTRRDADEIASYLSQVESDEMGLQPNPGRNRKVAEKILAAAP